MSISGYECFKLYIPLKLHYTLASFDVFATSRVKNTGLEYYNKRKDKYLFEGLSKTFSQPRECVRYYVSNFLYHNDNFLYDRETAKSFYLEWNKARQSITNTFSNDMEKIVTKYNVTKDIYDIFKLLIRGEIRAESLIILNKYNGIFDAWDTDDFKLIWGNNLMRLRKSERFVKFDESKITPIYDEYKKIISS